MIFIDYLYRLLFIEHCSFEADFSVYSTNAIKMNMD